MIDCWPQTPLTAPCWIILVCIGMYWYVLYRIMVFSGMYHGMYCGMYFEGIVVCTWLVAACLL